MVMPAPPIANFIVGQARLTLGTLQTIFHPVLRLLHARQFRQRRVGRRVAEMVIVLERARTGPLAGLRLLRAEFGIDFGTPARYDL